MGIFDATTETDTTVSPYLPTEDGLQKIIDMTNGGMQTPWTPYQINGQNASQYFTDQGTNLMDGLGTAQGYFNDALNWGAIQNNGPDMDMVAKLADNPYMNGMIDSVGRDVSRNLYENQMPGIAASSAGAGQASSSRRGAAEAIASRGAADRLADTSAGLRGNAYQNAVNLATGISENNANRQITNRDQGLGAAGQLSNMGQYGGRLLDAGHSMFREEQALPFLQAGAANDIMLPIGRAFPRTDQETTVKANWEAELLQYILSGGADDGTGSGFGGGLEGILGTVFGSVFGNNGGGTPPVVPGGTPPFVPGSGTTPPVVPGTAPDVLPGTTPDVLPGSGQDPSSSGMPDWLPVLLGSLGLGNVLGGSGSNPATNPTTNTAGNPDAPNPNASGDTVPPGAVVATSSTAGTTGSGTAGRPSTDETRAAMEAAGISAEVIDEYLKVNADTPATTNPSGATGGSESDGETYNELWGTEYPVATEEYQSSAHELAQSVWADNAGFNSEGADDFADLAVQVYEDQYKAGVQNGLTSDLAKIEGEFAALRAVELSGGSVDWNKASLRAQEMYENSQSGGPSQNLDGDPTTGNVADFVPGSNTSMTDITASNDQATQDILNVLTGGLGTINDMDGLRGMANNSRSAVTGLDSAVDLNADLGSTGGQFSNTGDLGGMPHSGLRDINSEISMADHGNPDPTFRIGDSFQAAATSGNYDNAFSSLNAMMGPGVDNMISMSPESIDGFLQSFGIQMSREEFITRWTNWRGES